MLARLAASSSNWGETATEEDSSAGQDDGGEPAAAWNDGAFSRESSPLGQASARVLVEWSRKIGDGFFGAVFAGAVYFRENHAPVLAAFKVTARGPKALNEVALTARVSHPYIVRYLCSWDCPITDKTILGVEYCPGGDLYTRMQNYSIPVSEALRLLAELAEALGFLHQHLILHGDIKPENVMLSGAGHVRLIDFGLSLQLQPGQDVVTSSGTLPYSAPEVLERRAHGLETDWWSFACLMHELVFMCYPWGLDSLHMTKDEKEVCRRICHDPLTPPANMDASSLQQSSAYAFLYSCLHKNPSERLAAFPSIREYLGFLLAGP